MHGGKVKRKKKGKNKNSRGNAIVHRIILFHIFCSSLLFAIILLLQINAIELYGMVSSGNDQ